MKIAWLKRAHPSPRVTLIPIIIRHTPNAVKGNGFSRWFFTFPIEARGLPLFLLFFSSHSVTLTLGLRIKLAGTKDGSRRKTDQQKKVIPRCLLESRTKKNLSRVSRGRRFLPPSFRSVISASFVLLALALPRGL